MKRFNRRIWAFVLAVCLSFTMAGVNAFAAEDSGSPDVECNNIAQPLSSGNVVTSGMSSFTNSTTITLTLSKATWNTDFCVGVLGNPGARYEVTLTMPSNRQYTMIVTGGSNKLSLFTSVLYASAGTYTFKFIRLSGGEVQATALAEIRD